MNDVVYVVLHDNYGDQGVDFHGVFAEKEDAEQYVATQLLAHWEDAKRYFADAAFPDEGERSCWDIKETLLQGGQCQPGFKIRGKKYVDRNGVLGGLAGRFRCCFHSPDCDAQRKVIAEDYAKEVDRLIATGVWDYAPGFEEMLTDEYMPKSFDEYWRKR